MIGESLGLSDHERPMSTIGEEPLIAFLRITDRLDVGAEGRLCIDALIRMSATSFVLMSETASRPDVYAWW